MSETRTISGLGMHCHHDVLFEFITDYDERVAYIILTKPANEQALRLRLFKIVSPDRIPGQDSLEWQAYETARQAYITASQAYETAWQAYYTARQAYYTAWQAYKTARQAYYTARQAYEKTYASELEALHRELCPDCPWDGKTIFTRKDEKGVWY